MSSVSKVLAAMAAMATMMAPALPARASDPGDEVPAQIVLRLLPGHDIADIINPERMVVRATFPPRSLYVVQALPGYDDDMDALVDQLRSDGRVSGCEKHLFNGVTEGSTQSFFVRVPPPPDYTDQPAARKLGLPQVHEYTTGAGVTVAVLDTGLSPHSYLAGHTVPGYDWLTGGPDTSDLADGIDQDGDGAADEMAGHGTFVAGVIHTTAPGAMLMPIRVLDSDGLGTSFALAAGIYHAIDHGARVINISLSSPEESFAVSEAVAEAISRGVVVVAAVGNEARGRSTYPAATTGVIGVAAIDLADRLLPTSDHGDHVSVCAPGQGILSVLPGEEHATATGTSFAAAFVSGITAMTVSKHPQWSPAAVRSGLMAQAVNIDALNPGFELELGAGRITAWSLKTGRRALNGAGMAPPSSGPK
ncbi:MAG: S8 family serine peptidase [Phycisphaerales bacterium]|nr:S8 family serine peptidase [Phycisphaerales bacterium]